MLPAGKSLRTLREKLGLTMRDVENSSARVADKYRNEEFSIPPSRLSDIETKGILPSIYRLYTLSVIYRRDIRELMSWYGVDLNNMAADLGLVSPPKSHVSDALAGLFVGAGSGAHGSCVRRAPHHQSGPHGRAMGTGAVRLPGAVCQQRFHLRLRRHAGFHDVSDSAAGQFHSGGRSEEQWWKAPGARNTSVRFILWRPATATPAAGAACAARKLFCSRIRCLRFRCEFCATRRKPKYWARWWAWL